MFRNPCIVLLSEEINTNGYCYILSLDLKLSTDKIVFVIKSISTTLEEANNERKESRRELPVQYLRK